MKILLACAALAFQWGVSTVSGDCPKLPSFQFARPTFDWCTKHSSYVNETCNFGCVYGYALEQDRDSVSFQFVCQPNGTWSGKAHKCVDIRRPDMNCPSDITVIAKPGRPSEVVSWKIEVDDNSIPVDPEAKVTVHSSHVSPHNFTIGRHYVQTTAADNRGNKAECWFLVIVRDLEPPTCSFCPSDIVKEANSLKERVTWKLPICSDNSHLPPIIRSNRQNGDIFGAPGKYKIQYTVKDFDFKEPNIYTGCSFMITLKRAKCPKYPPPKNGALVCLNHADDGSQIFCQVACKHGTDFVTNPSVFYACPASGEWLPLAYLPNTSGKLPWPDCAMGAGPSTMKTFRGGISEFFYNANQKPSEVERELKDNFLKLAQGKLVSPFLCKMKNYCKSENVRVYV